MLGDLYTVFGPGGPSASILVQIIAGPSADRKVLGWFKPSTERSRPPGTPGRSSPSVQCSQAGAPVPFSLAPVSIP